MKTQFQQMMDGLNGRRGFSCWQARGIQGTCALGCWREGHPQSTWHDASQIFRHLRVQPWRDQALGRWAENPEAPARTLLTVIDKNPAAVLTALNPAAFAAAVGSSKPPQSTSGLIESVQVSRGVTRRKVYSAGGKGIRRWSERSGVCQRI